MVTHEWMLRLVHGARPRSAIGKAVQYTLNQWPALTLCADHPESPIHNNTSELRLRQAVTGRKTLPLRRLRGRRGLGGALVLPRGEPSAVWPRTLGVL